MFRLMVGCIRIEPAQTKKSKGDLRPQVCKEHKVLNLWYIDVEGFDTSLPEDEMKEALTNHFKSCGVIAMVSFRRHPETDVVNGLVTITMMGNDADEKVMLLNGSELGGRKLVVKANPTPRLKLDHLNLPFGGSSVPGTS
ncbi:RNA-binding domain superfamily [Arabidopsis suecica]|uniref:RNA-binding domain superfamily n=1 Tax=Arabidopsis suecica TaxID=45249 RepID=A0A8T2EE00_ARASU|nr:RNA-binding domain superfamily [Arabidopsis suecica]